MGLKNTIARVYEQTCLSIHSAMTSAKAKKFGRQAAGFAALLLFSGAAATLSAQTGLSTTLSGAVAADGNGWLLWIIRIVGGFMVLGGLLASISGFNGNEEGYGKVTKVGGGVLLLLIGGYMVGQAATLITKLGLNNMFSAS